MESYSFVYNTHQLQILFWRLTDPPKSQTEAIQLLNSSAQVYASKAGSLVRQEKLPDGGRQYDNIKSGPEGTLHLRTRLYLRGDIFYQLSYGTYSPDGIDEQIAERFFSSFNFLDARANKLSTQRRDRGKSTLPANIGQNRWYILSGKDRDFLIEFPDKPSRQVISGGEAGTTYYQYNYFFGEDTFIFGYRERYKNEPESTEEIIRRAAANFVSTYENWRVLRQSRLPDGSYEVISEGVINGTLMRMRTRLYTRGNRLYFVTGYTKNLAGPESDSMKRYFSSFRLL